MKLNRIHSISREIKIRVTNGDVCEVKNKHRRLTTINNNAVQRREIEFVLFCNGRSAFGLARIIFEAGIKRLS